MRNIHHVLVVGEGAVGTDIAQICAEAVPDASVTVLGEHSPEADLRAAAQRADLVVEALGESLDPKQSLLHLLDSWCATDVVLATTTGSSQVARVAERCTNQDRVVGTRWPSSDSPSKLVEIVPGAQTSAETVDSVQQFVVSCGSAVVILRKDVPGSIGNRLAMAMSMEALRLADEGVATVEDVDRVAVGMYRHPAGPFQALDNLGLSEAAVASASMADFYADDRYVAAPLLAEMIARGDLGRASGQGFYAYPSHPG